MTSPLSYRDRRALLIGGVFVAVAVAAVWAKNRPNAYADLPNDALEMERTLLAHELGLISRTPAVLRGAESTRQQLASEASRLFVRLSGARPGEEGQALEDFVRLVAAASGVTVLEVVPLPSEEPDDQIGLERGRLGITAEGDFAAAMALVEGLEDGPKLIRLESFRLNAVSDGPTEEMAEVLRIEATVAGWLPLDR